MRATYARIFFAPHIYYSEMTTRWRASRRKIALIFVADAMRLALWRGMTIASTQIEGFDARRDVPSPRPQGKFASHSVLLAK